MLHKMLINKGGNKFIMNEANLISSGLTITVGKMLQVEVNTVDINFIF